MYRWLIRLMEKIVMGSEWSDLRSMKITLEAYRESHKRLIDRNAELQRMLEIMIDGEATGTAFGPEDHPMPGIDDLPKGVRRIRFEEDC